MKAELGIQISRYLIYKFIEYNRYVLGGNLYRYLRNHGKPRKAKWDASKVKIVGRIGIEHRPEIASSKEEYGHFEGDTIVSSKSSQSKQALAVIYERKAKYIEARKIKNLTPKQLNTGFEKILGQLKAAQTLTLDNGLENRYHEQLGLPVYFCDPYSSWQKPGVENANKMIRRYLPKGTDLGNYSSQYVTMVIRKINQKPRKSLGYRTPLEVMLKHHLLIKKEPKGSVGKNALRG